MNDVSGSVHRYTVTTHARTEKLPEPPPGTVEKWNDRLNSDLSNVRLDPNPGCITLSFGPVSGAAAYLVRRSQPTPPPLTRWQRMARAVRVAWVRAQRRWRS